MKSLIFAAFLSALQLTLSVGLVSGQEADTAGGDQKPARGSIVEDRAARKLVEAGDARFDADEMNKAVEVWQSVIERYPRSRVRYDAHMRLGNFLLERERAYDRARVHFEAVSAEENSDEEQRAEATLKMGMCFYEARNMGKCFKIMRDVIEKFPVSPQVNNAYYYIGLGHFQLGHYSRAISALEKVGTALSSEDGKVEKVEAGKRLFIKIEDADLAALEPGQAIKVRCESGQGDVETVDCYPVGRNVRLVLGSILTSLGKPRASNGMLEVRGNDKVVVSYTDAHTADKQFDRKVLKEVTVVGGGVVEATDGAFAESVHGVILGRPLNLQITDADLDLTDGADQLKAIVEVFREKTQEELDAEAAKAAAANPAGTANVPADPTAEKSADEDNVERFKRIDGVQVVLTEAKVTRLLPQSSSISDDLPSEDGKSADGDASESSAKDASASRTDEGASPKPATSAKASGKSSTKKTGASSSAPAGEPGTEKSSTGTKGSATKAAAGADSEAQAPPAAPASPPEPPDDSIHSGVFRIGVPVANAEEVIADDDTLQALPGDVVQITYVDERNITEGPRQLTFRVKCIEGNLGEVRVTRSVITDQELRIKTQLKTAGALTNIASRYKEFGLKKNADAKYQQALQVCEEVTEEAGKLGGRLLEEMYVQLWQIYYEMDNLELAAAMCQRLQREFPNSGFVDDALLQLAGVIRKQGELQRAIGIYTRLVEMKTSLLRGEAQFGVAECYKEMAKAAPAGPGADQLHDRAFQEYKKVFDNFPESGRVGEAVAEMANYYFQQKDYARAIDVFESVLSDHPDAKFLDVILFNYGRCLFRMERRPEARRQFDQLIADFPESPLATDAKRISEELAKRGF